MEKPPDISDCGCPKSLEKPSKFYQEIGAEVIGNRLTIRVEKERKKSKNYNQYDPPCNCKMPEIKRPTSTQGPLLINAGNDNKIIFRINSKSNFESNDPNVYPELLSYGLEGDGKNQQRKIVVYPKIEGGGNQDIQQNHVTIGDQQVFMMKIKKNPDGKEKKKRNVELEVRYPKLPPRPPTPPPPPPPPPPQKIEINPPKPPEEQPTLSESSVKQKKKKKKK